MYGDFPKAYHVTTPVTTFIVDTVKEKILDMYMLWAFIERQGHQSYVARPLKGV